MSSRNDPCHCGSGQRYKHCHGNLGEDLAQPLPVAMSDDSLARASGACLFYWADATSRREGMNVVYIDDTCIAFALALTDPAVFNELVRVANAKPDLASDIVASHGNRFTRDSIACIKLTARLKLLQLIPRSGGQFLIPYGENDVQEKILSAVSRSFGVTIHEERANIQSSLAALPVGALTTTLVFGGLLILFTALSDPDAQFRRRNRLLKMAFNEFGGALKGSIGVVGVCALVGVAMLAILGPSLYRLATRPVSRVIRI